MEKHIWQAGILQKNSPCPSHRWGQATTKISNEMVIFGGYADSLYMNDLWSFNGETMKWTSIQTTGEKPSHRSNATIHYDHIHNNIILFGGGGQNKLRYNDIYVLSWQNRQWRKEECMDSGSIPWERTYHSSQFLYPYLFVFGGEAVSDLNDLWAYNIETKVWVEIKTKDTKTKPCPRRFHSSGLIGNNLYIVAGCHDKYRCLNDVFCIDLTPFLAQSIVQLQWNELKFKGTSFLTRWGQSSAVFEDKIYIFGGRFSSDLQDLIVFDPLNQTIKIIKVSGQIPQGRRRHSLTFFGSSLLIFGGFNGQYFNDINFVNVFDINYKKEEIISSQVSSRANWLNNQFLSDYKITTKDSEQFFIHIGLIKSKFEESYQMYQFLEDINGVYSKAQLLQLFQTLYIGIGNISEDLGLRDYNFKLYDTEVQEDSIFKKKLCPCLPQKFSLTMRSRISSKIIHVQQQKYNQFIQQLQDQMLHDVTIILNDQYCIPANKIILSSGSKYFQYLFKGQKTAQINLKMEDKMGDVRIFQAVHMFLQTGYLIVPKQIDYICWMYLVKQASYFSLSNLQAICMQQLLTHINQLNYQQLLLFSIQNGYKVLASFCGEFLFKFLNFRAQDKQLKLPLISQKFISDSIKYYEQLYSFELKQTFLRKRLLQKEKVHFNHNEQNQNNYPMEM